MFQTIPYDIRFTVFTHLSSIADVHNLQKTCKFLYEPVAKHPRSIYSSVAPENFAEIGWTEILRLLRTKQAAPQVKTLELLLELPFAVQTNACVDPAIYTNPSNTITEQDLQELLVLETIICYLAEHLDPAFVHIGSACKAQRCDQRNYRTTSNILLLDALSAKTGMVFTMLYENFHAGTIFSSRGEEATLYDAMMQLHVILTFEQNGRGQILLEQLDLSYANHVKSMKTLREVFTDIELKAMDDMLSNAVFAIGSM